MDNHNHAWSTITFVESMMRIKIDEEDAYKERERNKIYIGNCGVDELRHLLTPVHKALSFPSAVRNAAGKPPLPLCPPQSIFFFN